MLNILKTASLMAMLQAALNSRAKAERVSRAYLPPQPRTRSHAGRHYPRHATNSADHFAAKSGLGKRECHRRRVGNLGTFRKEAEAWLS
jgi:hypothetical protein